MKDYWFFLSYARRDAINNIYLQKFYEELAQELAVAAGLPSNLKETDIGFFDKQGIELGDTWDEALAEALQSSKAFVALYSRAYFNSHPCGKEFQVFNMRVEDYKKQLSPEASQPNLIIPVLWQPVERLPSTLPESVAKLQFSHASLPAKYEKDGLSVLMKRKQDRAAFIRKLADSIYKEVEAHKLPKLQNLPPLEKVQSAFHQQQPAAGAPVAAGAPAAAASLPATVNIPNNAGPDVAWFVYVAGKDADYQAIRKSTDCYGTVGGLDWRPYHPKVESKVGLIAQGVANSKNLLSETLPLSEQLIDHMRKADANNTIVVIIVDPWSVSLPSFKKPLLAYDQNRLLNSGAIVIWNDSDPETAGATGTLKKTLFETFPNILVSEDIVFQDSVRSEPELREQLSAVIDEVKRKIEKRANLLRPVDNTQSTSFPTLTVPTPES